MALFSIKKREWFFRTGMAVLFFVCAALVSTASAPYAQAQEAAVAPAKPLTLGDVKEKIAGIPERYAFTVGDITEEAAGRRLILKQVAFTLPHDAVPCSVSMERIVAEGLAFTEENGAPHLLADKLTITGLKTTGKDFDTLSEHLVLSGFNIDLNVGPSAWGRYARFEAFLFVELADMLLEGIPAPDKSKEPFPFPYMSSGYFSRNETSSARYGENVTRISIDSTSFENARDNPLGPLRLNGLRADRNGREFLSVVGLGFDLVAFPGKGAMNDNFEVLFQGKDIFASEFQLKNCFIKEMALTTILPDGEPSVISLARLGMDMGNTDKQRNISVAVDRFAVAKKLLFSKVKEQGYTALPAMLDPLIPETLVWDFQTVLGVSPLENGQAQAVISPLALSIENLGSASLRATMQGEMDDWRNASVSHMALDVTDLGLSEVFFTLAKESPEKGTAAFRQEIRMGISSAALVLQGSIAKLNADLAEFLKGPGATLRMTVAPQKPISAITMETIITQPESLGLSSSVERK